MIIKDSVTSLCDPVSSYTHLFKPTTYYTYGAYGIHVSRIHVQLVVS
jgi:hypothetical protein